MKLRVMGVSQDLEEDELTNQESLVTTMEGHCLDTEDKYIGDFHIQVKNQEKLFGYVRPGDTLQVI